MAWKILLAAVYLTSTAGAQSAVPAGIARVTPSGKPPGALLRAPPQTAPARPASAWAVVSSMILPGSGQALLRQERFVPYAAAEAFFLMRYAQHAHDARRERDRYRALAANVARAPFGPNRAHGSFDYYESMEHFVESGVFDASAGSDIDPEPDTTTFNGRLWLLARRTYWRDVNSPPPRDSREWQLAESFYVSRAVGAAFRWSWRDAQLEYDEFRRTIRRSNDAYRDALTDLSVIIANHVLSGVDALISVRLRARPVREGRGRGMLIRGEIPIR
jgi:hypothetical protein